ECRRKTLDAFAPARRLSHCGISKSDSVRDLSSDSLDRCDGGRLRVRCPLSENYKAAPAASPDHRGLRHRTVYPCPLDRSVRRSVTMVSTEQLDLHGPVIYQHDEIPAVALVLIDDIGAGDYRTGGI